MNHVRQNKRSGQSLIEAMIAISLLTTGFLGLVALLSQSLFLNRVVSDETTATYLASEGIEIAKNLIDHDIYLQLAGQGTGWGTCFSQNKDVELDYTTTDCTTLVPFITPGHSLWYDPVTHLYGYQKPPSADDPLQTAFTREIRVNENGNTITVDSIVRWSTGPLSNQSVDLEDVFYNWRPQP